MAAEEDSAEVVDLVCRQGLPAPTPALAMVQSAAAAGAATTTVGWLQAYSSGLVYAEAKAPVSIGKLYDIRNAWLVRCQCAPLAAERVVLLMGTGDEAISSVYEYKRHVLQGVLLGCRARDYQHLCATVKQLSPLKITIAGRNYNLKTIKLVTGTGEVFSPPIAKTNAYAGRDWIVTFEETAKIPEGVVVGDRLEVIGEEKYPVVTEALEPFYRGMRSIANWNVLERIYGPKNAYSYAPVDPAPRTIRKGGVEFALNPEQSEAVGRYVSTESSCPIFVVESPPGSGKTTTAAAMAASYTGPGLQLFLSVANVPVDNMVAALHALDRSKNMNILHLVAGSREVAQSEDKRSPFSCMKTPEGKWIDRHHAKLNELHFRSNQLASSNEHDGLGEAADRKAKKKIKNKMLRTRTKILKENVQYDVIFGTVDMILSMLLKKKSCPIQRQLLSRVTRVTIDEASQLPAAALNALILSFNGAKFAVFGDSKQLPPYMYEAEEISSKLAARSTLDVLKQQGNVPVIRLTHVYRAAPSLVRHYSDVFYEGTLVSGKPETKEFNLGRISSSNRCLFVQVKGKTKQSGTSKINDGEIGALQAIIAELRLAGHYHRHVIVICYYEAQCRLVKTRIDQKYEVHTVDSAQGREADISIVLTTRTKATTADFFTSHLRANVAMSRQKEAIIVLGTAALRETDPWSALLDDKYFTTVDFESIRATL